MEVLDAGDRLDVHDEDEVASQYRSGGLTVCKDSSLDRFILDARVPNLFELILMLWTLWMGSVLPLLHMILLPTQVFRFSSDEVRDFYYKFLISKLRSLRNSFC